MQACGSTAQGVKRVKSASQLHVDMRLLLGLTPTPKIPEMPPLTMPVAAQPSISIGECSPRGRTSVRGRTSRTALKRTLHADPRTEVAPGATNGRPDSVPPPRRPVARPGSPTQPWILRRARKKLRALNPIGT